MNNHDISMQQLNITLFLWEGKSVSSSNKIFHQGDNKNITVYLCFIKLSFKKTNLKI